MSSTGDRAWRAPTASISVRICSAIVVHAAAVSHVAARPIAWGNCVASRAQKPADGLLVDHRGDPQSGLLDQEPLDLVVQLGEPGGSQPRRRRDAGDLSGAVRHQLGRRLDREPAGAVRVGPHQLGRPDAAELGELLVQRHATEQVVDAVLDRQLGCRGRCRVRRWLMVGRCWRHRSGLTASVAGVADRMTTARRARRRRSPAPGRRGRHDPRRLHRATGWSRNTAADTVDSTGMASVMSEVSTSVVWACAQFIRMWPDPGTSTISDDRQQRVPVSAGRLAPNRSPASTAIGCDDRERDHVHDGHVLEGVEVGPGLLRGDEVPGPANSATTDTRSPTRLPVPLPAAPKATIATPIVAITAPTT